MEFGYNLSELTKKISVVKNVSLCPSDRTLFEVLRVTSANLVQRTLIVHMLLENRKSLHTIIFTEEYYGDYVFYRVMFGDMAPLVTYNEVRDQLIVVDMD